MTDLDALKREAQAYMRGEFSGPDYTAACSLIQRLLPALEDARRYRWLRDLPVDSPNAQIGNFPGDWWDAEIDLAMEKADGK